MSPVNADQLKAVRIGMQAALDECSRSPVGNLLEGHLKVVLVDSLLRAGYSVLEGSTRNIGKAVRMQDGKLKVTEAERPKMDPATGSEKRTLSPDLRIWSPVQVVVELQIRTVLGSQDALFSDNLVDDFDRVHRGVADAFILAADRPIYDALRGIKKDPRGRKPKHPEQLASSLPDVEKLEEQFPAAAIPSACGRFQCLAAIARTSFGLDRIVAGFWTAA